MPKMPMPVPVRWRGMMSVAIVEVDVEAKLQSIPWSTRRIRINAIVVMNE